MNGKIGVAAAAALLVLGIVVLGMARQEVDPADACAMLRGQAEHYEGMVQRMSPACPDHARYQHMVVDLRRQMGQQGCE